MQDARVQHGFQRFAAIVLFRNQQVAGSIPAGGSKALKKHGMITATTAESLCSRLQACNTFTEVVGDYAVLGGRFWTRARYVEDRSIHTTRTGRVRAV